MSNKAKAERSVQKRLAELCAKEAAPDSKEVTT
jgi:hypothetical protein